MQITFSSEKFKEEFLSLNFLRMNGCSTVINDDDRLLRYLNIYDAPHELPDSAIVFRLQPFCHVVTKWRGKYANMPDVFNGMRHYRVRMIKPIPSYLRFGKFLIRLSHDGQQHTCRRCNEPGHFANECTNEYCFNCEEIGHMSKNCEEPLRCAICKSTSHLARFCRFSWYRSPPRSCYPDQDNPQPSNTEPSSQPDNVNNQQTDNANNQQSEMETSSDPAEAQQSMSQPEKPLAPQQTEDLLMSQQSVVPLSPQQSEEPSERVLNTQGFLVSQHSADGENIPRPTQETIDLTNTDQDPLSPEQSATSEKSLDSQRRPTNASEKSRTSNSRRKPAPTPPPLSTLGHRPTKPTLVTSGKKTSDLSQQGSGELPADTPPKISETNDTPETNEDHEMEELQSLKRKQDQRTKKGHNKKGRN